MLRVGPVAFVASLIAAANSFVPFAATAEPEHSEQPDPVVVTLPSRAQLASSGAPSDLGPLSQFAIAAELTKGRRIRRRLCRRRRPVADPCVRPIPQRSPGVVGSRR